MFFAVFCGCAASDPYSRLARELSKPLAGPQKRVAVAPFSRVDGGKTTAGATVAERLTTELSRQGKVGVVERSMLARLMEEARLVVTGAFDPKSAKKIGELTGADAIVTGTLADDLGGQTEINARMVDVTTGRVLAAARATAPNLTRWDEPIESIERPAPPPWKTPEPAPPAPVLAEPTPVLGNADLPPPPQKPYSDSDVRGKSPITGEWPVAAAIGGKIYVLAGRSPEGPLGTFQALDPKTKAWTRLHKPYAARIVPSGGAAAGKFYVVGGCFGGICSNGVTNLVDVFDPASGWSRGIGSLSARGSLNAAVVDDKLYAIGGHPACPPCAPQFAALEEFDPARGTWQLRAAMPTPREAAATAVVDGKIYVFGGIDRTKSVGSAVETGAVEVYDPRADKWESKKPMPLARYEFATAVIGGKVHLFGGYNATSNRTVRTVDVYDPKTDSWSQGTPMPWPRHGMAVVHLDGTVYMFGGTIGERAGDIVVTGWDSFDVASKKWTSHPAVPVQ